MQHEGTEGAGADLPRAAAAPAAARGVRGATTVEVAADGGLAAAVEDATAELLGRMLADNGLATEDVAAAIFTLQDDLHGVNPAAAARARGWDAVPLLMVREHGGDTRVARCLRVLLLVNTPLPQSAVRHAYLRGASGLRPDLAAPSTR